MKDQLELIGDISQVETIAIKHKIKELNTIEQEFGKGRWRKLKGTAKVRLESGEIRLCEIHWYEAHGIGKCKLKIKYFLD